MLQTTVSYLSLIEQSRHNKETERQADKQLFINEGELRVHQSQASEQARHNLATEQLGWSNLDETTRHNRVTESVNLFDAETRRQHIGIEAMNAETNRYAAVQSAGIGWENAKSNARQASVAERQANNGFLQAASSASQATTSAVNAETRQGELEHKVQYDNVILKQNQQGLDIQQQNADTNLFDAKTRRYDLYRKTVDSAANNAREGIKTVTSVWSYVNSATKGGK